MKIGAYLFLSMVFMFCQSCATKEGTIKTGDCCNDHKAAVSVAAAPDDDLDLQKLTKSIVRIKVKVAQKMKGTKLQESFEYGTGFFVNDRGLILTSAHVISMAKDARSIIIYHTGRELQARPLRTYREVDLATLLVDAGKTVPLPMNDSKPTLGEDVYAIGFPFADIFKDSAPAVSGGHVAGVGREIEYEGRAVKDLVLTDAFVADGCSGGPLVNQRGQVIGVLRFNLSRKGSWMGLSFAEPIKSYMKAKGSDK